MRIVFMGTPEFAVPALRALASKHDVCAVITAPDKPAGRGKKLSVSAIKAAALELGIEVMQPTNLKDPAFLDSLSARGADLFVVVAFRMLPEAVWAMPPKGTINLHASLLPDYRGAAPINRAIMDGQKETGLTTFFIEKDIDTGMVIDQVKLPIGPDENAGSLHDRMMDRGAELLLHTAHLIEKDAVEPKSQQALLASMEETHEAPKIFKEDCQIEWTTTQVDVHNHVRGLSPFPGAWTSSAAGDGTELIFKIFETRLSKRNGDGPAGLVQIEGSEMYVRTADGWIQILELQAPGKKRMRTADFLRGYRPPNPWKFD